MALKTLVKVGNISNLSDARYCAGMGVDMLGYSVTEGSKTYISTRLYEEIKGWIAGPASVAELYGISGPERLEAAIGQYRPDYLELHVDQLPIIDPGISLPLIVSVDGLGDLEEVRSCRARIGYVQVNESQPQIALEASPDFEVLILLQSAIRLQTLLTTLPLRGVSLIGGPEARPGYKDYGDLAEILEKLQVE